MLNVFQNDLARGRKRRFSEDEEMNDAPSLESASFATKRHSKSYEMKRFKSGHQMRSSNSAMLVMDKEKLIEIIMSLVDAHPDVSDNIMSLIPAPTIASAKTVLLQMEKQLAESFPYNRNGPTRDDYTYSRVREPLQNLIDTVAQYAHHFTSSIVPSNTCFAFLDLAADIAHRLPEWENNKNNTPRYELYVDLNNYWKIAIAKLRESGFHNPQSVSEWVENLARHNNYTNGLFLTAIQEFSKLLMTRILPPTEAPVCHRPALEAEMNRFSSQSSPMVGYAGAHR